MCGWVVYYVGSGRIMFESLSRSWFDVARRGIRAGPRPHGELPVRARRPMCDLERDVHGRRLRAHHLLLLLELLATALDRDTQANLCLLLDES